MSGFGATAQQQLAMTSVTSAGSIMKGLVSNTNSSQSSDSSSGGGSKFGATDIIGIAVSGVTLLLAAIFARKGPKQKVATTEIVNKIEPLLQQNLAGYMAGPHTVSSQAQALANFDAGWAYVEQYCDTPEMGNPGKACVSDRQAGACAWRDSAGACWNWFSGYRDPIANDPKVVPDPVVDEVGNLIDSVTGGLFSSSSTATGTSATGWLLLAGLAIAGIFMLGGDGK
jgi:hypothetical protein